MPFGSRLSGFAPAFVCAAVVLVSGVSRAQVDGPPISERIGEGIVRFHASEEAKAERVPSMALVKPRDARGPAPAGFGVSVEFSRGPSALHGDDRFVATIDIEPGTKVTWINEDVFTAMAGEQSGAHNVATTSGPERFGSPMLGHAESWSYTFEAEGTYDYMCTPHPYMKGQVVVRERSGGEGIPASIAWALLPAILALGVSVVAWRRTRTPQDE